MARVANVIKTLGETTSAGSIPVISEAHPSQYGDITVVDLSNQLQPSNQVLERSGAGLEVDVNEDHAYLLANKWVNANKLAELVKTQGTHTRLQIPIYFPEDGI
jgi:hypothetical protein